MVIGTVFEASARCVTVGKVTFDLFEKPERVWEHVNYIILPMSKLHTAVETAYGTAYTRRILQGARSPWTWGQVA